MAVVFYLVRESIIWVATNVEITPSNNRIRE